MACLYITSVYRRSKIFLEPGQLANNLRFTWKTDARSGTDGRGDRQGCHHSRKVRRLGGPRGEVRVQPGGGTNARQGRQAEIVGPVRCRGRRRTSMPRVHAGFATVAQTEMQKLQVSSEISRLAQNRAAQRTRHWLIGQTACLRQSVP